ncbi:exodeoxyribonuclease III [Chelatococcus reniformis]|uniref:Exodeoxyribonuclease III n=1 Tax=Chelatococcus reniformis TaxID=1494448 RepID=A0A916U1A8_9HYPH|nr:exodeoxyribonuclease III [Chelatococcus reniformis]GGC55303.1 exodeoxyribonuclease III [Chelatococcus reniformis]
MRIATWNVNSVKQRLDHLTGFLKEVQPDVLCLQEIKCVDEAFPTAEVADLGYNAAVHGQKGFNGVALLSRLPLEDVRRGLPGDESDNQSRYIEAVVSVPSGAVRVASIYLPNGNPLGTEKFAYKLAWMERLGEHMRALLALEEAAIFGGDYNVIPDERDAKDPAAWIGDALFQPESRAFYRAFLNLGLTDALRACRDEGGLYTFWDYQAGAWQRDFGIRIDHLLLTPRAADRLRAVEVHKSLRALAKPSDHVPVAADLDL